MNISAQRGINKPLKKKILPSISITFLVLQLVLNTVLSFTYNTDISNYFRVSAADPVVQVTISRNKTGSEPFDSSTFDSPTNSTFSNGDTILDGSEEDRAGTQNTVGIAGEDESEDNDVVRLQDSITYKVEANCNDETCENLIAKVILDENQSWIEIPSGCETDASAYSPISQIVDSTDNTDENGNDRVLICNLGESQEGTARVVYPAARALAIDSNGTPTLNDDIVEAEVEAYNLDASGTQDSNTATDGPVETLVTAGFAIDLLKELKVTAVDDEGNPLYTPVQALGPNGEDGYIIEWVIRAEYQKGSMIADSDESTYEIDLDLIDIYTDGDADTFYDTGIDNDGDGVSDVIYSTNGVLFDPTWDTTITTISGCELLGNNGTNSQITCTENPIVIDYLDATGAENTIDNFEDPNIGIELENIDVRDPDSDSNLFKAMIPIWYPENDIALGVCDGNLSSCTIGEANDIQLFDPANGTIEPFDIESTEDAGGTNLPNYGIGDDPKPNNADFPLSTTSPGPWNALKTFQGNPWATAGTGTKTGSRKVAPGEIVEYYSFMSDRRTTDNKGQTCDFIDTNLFEFQGIILGRSTDVLNPTLSGNRVSPSIRGNTNGVGVTVQYGYGVEFPLGGTTTTTNSGLNLYRQDFLEIYNAGIFDIDYSTSTSGWYNDLANPTCNDSENFYSFVDCEPALGGAWNSSNCPIQPENVTKVRATLHKNSQIMADFFNNETNLELGYLGSVKVKESVDINTTDYLRNFMTDRNDISEPWLPLDAIESENQKDLLYSFNRDNADRLELVASFTQVAKRTEPAGIKVVKGGDLVDYVIEPEVGGKWSNPEVVEISDNLPSPNQVYLQGTEMFSTDNGATWLSLADYNTSQGYNTSNQGVPIDSAPNSGSAGSLVWDFIDVEEGEQLPWIKYTVKVDESLTNATMTNTVTLSSPNISSIDKGASYQISVQPKLGFDVLKIVADQVYNVNEKFEFDLIYKNLGGAEPGVTNFSMGSFIDILPYIDDGVGQTSSGLASTRYPSSTYNGWYEITGLSGTNGETFYATDHPSNLIPQDPCDVAHWPAGHVPVLGDLCYNVYIDDTDSLVNALPDSGLTPAGGITWDLCGTTPLTSPITCGGLDPKDITAIRFDVAAISAGGQTATVELTPVGNVGGEPEFSGTYPEEQLEQITTGDIYTNTFGGRVPELSLQVISNDVSVTVVSGSIGDQVWLDTNGDGVIDAGETMLEGIDLALLIEDEDPASPTYGQMIPYQVIDADPASPTYGQLIDYIVTTDANGEYLFENLPSANYQIDVDTSTLPNGVDQTYDADDGNLGAGGAYGSADSSTYELQEEIDPVTGQLLDVEDNDEQDFGYQGQGIIGDTIWVDTDGDGVIATDGSEPGIEGVEVTVTYLGDPNDPSDDIVFVVTTDANGEYLLENLPYGDYTVEINPDTLPAGYAQTYDEDGNLDNQSSTTLTPEEPEDLDQDFGYQPLGTIGDYVWIDSNGDGVQDAGELPIEGVEIHLLDGNGNPVLDDNGNPIIATTDANGQYLFEDLPAGDYIIEVDPDTLPTGYTQTYDEDGNLDNQSSVTLGTYINEDGEIDIEDNLDQDFGYRPLATIGDTIWLDSNGDGVQDTGEDGISGVIVNLLDSNGNPVLDDNGNPITTTTDSNGNYIFENLPYGEYTVQIDPNTLPPNLQSTYDADGGNPYESTLTVGDPATCGCNGIEDLDQDFGFVAQGPTISLNKEIKDDEIDLIKVGNIEEKDGEKKAEGTYKLTYEIEVKNIGEVDLYNLQLEDDLDDVFEDIDNVEDYKVVDIEVDTIEDAHVDLNEDYNGKEDNDLLDNNSNPLDQTENYILEGGRILIQIEVEIEVENIYEDTEDFTNIVELKADNIDLNTGEYNETLEDKSDKTIGIDGEEMGAEIVAQEELQESGYNLVLPIVVGATIFVLIGAISRRKDKESI